MPGDIEYEYGVWNKTGNADWTLVARPHLDLEVANSAMEYFQKEYPADKFKVMKRAVGGWEPIDPA